MVNRIGRCCLSTSALVVAAVTLSCASDQSAQAGLFFYTFEDNVSGPGVVSATLITDTNNTGAGFLTASDILHWSWTADNGNFSDSGTLVHLDPGFLSATPTSLHFNATLQDGSNLQFGNNLNGILRWESDADGIHFKGQIISQGEPLYTWDKHPITTQFVAPGGSNVPEPSTFVLFSGLGGLGLLIRRRAKREWRTPV